MALGCGRPCGWVGCCGRATAASGHGPAVGSRSGGSGPEGWLTPVMGAGGFGQRARGRAGSLWGAWKRRVLANSCAGVVGATWRRVAVCDASGQGFHLGAWGSVSWVGAWPPGRETPCVWGEGSLMACASAARERGCSAAEWRGNSGAGKGNVCEEVEREIWEGHNTKIIL